jgi:hypothetical protein
MQSVELARGKKPCRGAASKRSRTTAVIHALVGKPVEAVMHDTVANRVGPKRRSAEAALKGTITRER